MGEYERDVCKWGVIMSCLSQADCPSAPVPSPADGQAMVTLMKYETSDCNGKPTKVQFPAGVHKGSPCFSMGTYAVKDQFCDADGKFKQTVYAGSGCAGDGTDQVFDPDHAHLATSLALVRVPNRQESSL